MGVVNSQERETINSPKTGPCLCFQGSTSNWIRDKQSAHADSRKLQNQTIISSLVMKSKLTSFLTIKISVINKQSGSKTAKIRLLLMFIFPTWSRILRPLQTLQSLLFFFFFLLPALNQPRVLVPPSLLPRLLLFIHLSVSQTVHQSVARRLLCQHTQGWMLPSANHQTNSGFPCRGGMLTVWFSKGNYSIWRQLLLFKCCC